MKARDPGGLFEYVPRQAEGFEQLFPEVAQDDFNTGMRLVGPDGTVSVGADAVYQIARRLKGWQYLAWLYRVPVLRWCFRRAYALVAKHRNRLAKSCTTGACQV